MQGKLLWVLRLVLFVAALAAPAVAADFANPEAALDALQSALKADDVPALDDVLGPGSEALLRSGDPVADHAARERFLTSLEAAHHLQPEGENRQILIVGPNDWPFPIPLVQTDGRWHFDSAQGAQAIVDRRIGQNEIAAIRSLLEMVDAQRAYFDLRHEYSRHFLSNPGKQDGLYWPIEDDQPPSPLASLAADADEEGYTLDALRNTLSAFRGYRFRVLTGQGPSAPGGAKSYLVRGRLTGGFALLAWPATHDSSGIMSFQVGPDGVVFQKDLGPETTAAAARITRFDPDLSWARVDIKD